MLGGVKGSFEYFIASIIVLWILLGLFTNLGQIKEKINFYLLTCFVFFVLTFIFFPDKYLNTLFLSQRWFPFAIIFLIIALPNPRFSKEIVLLSLFFLLIIFSTATAKIWSEYEKKELAGLSYSLNKIPVGKKVLGLDFIKNSTYIKGRPFLNIFAYALVLRENEINSSFVSHPVELLTNKVMKINKVTPGLEWFPENFSNEDFRYFDYVLINGGGLTHAIFAKQSFLDPITKTGRWRLYSVLKNKGYKFSLQ